jgi:hypothetical protein
MISLLDMVVNVHKFFKHQRKEEGSQKARSLGTWRHVTCFKYCYPNIPDILVKQYGLNSNDRIIVYITKEVCLPKFNRYRTRFRKVFHGTVEEYGAYLKAFLKTQKRKKEKP